MQHFRLFILTFFFFYNTLSIIAQSLNTPVQHVVVVGVDGMSPDGVRKANTPVMDRLMAEGAFTFHARCVTPSTSSSNWASMIMGADVEQHGINSNDYERDNFVLPPVTVGNEDLFPTIFGILRDQKPDAKIGAIYQWRGFGRLFEKSAVNLDTCGKNEYITAQLAAGFIKKEKPSLCFVHLDHVDDAGHEHGHGSQEYYAAVSRADSLIGQIWQAVKDAGMAENTLFVVSADHGGVGHGHGGYAMAEMEIPFILWGKAVKNNFAITLPVYQYDNAATLAFALGIEQPYAWIGRPVKTAFVGFSNETDKYPAIQYLDAPTFDASAQDNRKAGGLFFSQKQVKLSTETGKEIRYTLDGKVPNAQSPIYSEPFTLNKNTVVRAGLFSNGAHVSEIADAYYRFVPYGADKTVSYQVFLGEELENIPDLSKMKPVSSGKTWELCSDGIPLPRPEQVIVQLESDILIETAGFYNFYTRSDDGSVLWVDGIKVVNNDGTHGVVEKSGKIKLESGMHNIQLIWFNSGGGGYLDSWYMGPGIVKQLIPASVLKD